MTTAVYTSSCAPVDVRGGRQQRCFFSLAADDSSHKDMQPRRDQPRSSTGLTNIPRQLDITTPATKACSVQPPKPWPNPSLPHLLFPTSIRSSPEYPTRSGSLLSPTSQLSGQTTPSSTSERAYPSDRFSYDCPPQRLSNTPRGRTRSKHANVAASQRSPPAPTALSQTSRSMDTLAPQTEKNPKSRIHLHIRQQPRAARAGPDGKDRRAIDPPPILQLLLDDFDIDSEVDQSEIRSQSWVVYCKLVAAHSPETDVSTQTLFTEDGRKEVQRLLLGTNVACPLVTSDDPDPPTMPLHPTTRPPSPTSRFLPASTSKTSSHEIPGAFFIFADLSVRKAGEYRLHFILMNMSPESLMVGSGINAVDQVTSDVFRAVNAKDFDQVHASTNLVKGLLDRGAGFPLKLKKGTREGQGRKRQHSSEESEDDSDHESS